MVVSPNVIFLLSGKCKLFPSNVRFDSAFSTLAVFDPVIIRLSALLLIVVCVLVSVESNVICPSLFLVMVIFAPPINWIASSLPDEASKNIFGLSLFPPVCCAFNR